MQELQCVECKYLVGLIIEKEGIEEIGSFKCKYYAISPPPCHLKLHDMFYKDMNTCGHRNGEE